MNKKSIFIILIMVLSFSPIFGENIFQAKEISKVTLDNLPVMGRSFPCLDVVRGYIGVIGDFNETTRTNRFVLYNPDGQIVFSTKSKNNCPFFNINMNSSDRIISLTGRISEVSYRDYIYDYSGKLLFPPIKEDSRLRPSPNGKYFYTVNNYFYGSIPNVYDNLGNLIGSFKISSDIWELAAINDTLLLFQHKKTIQLISVPSLVVEKELIAENIRPPSVPRIALSPDGSCFAFAGYMKIVICNLETGIINYVDYEAAGYYIIKPEFILSDRGEYLFRYDRNGLTFTIYRLENNTYKRVLDNVSMIPTGQVAYPAVPPIIMGDYCIVNFFEDRDVSSMEYRSCIFNYRMQKEGPFNGLAFEGFLSPAGVEMPLNIYQVDVNTNEKSIRLLELIIPD